jgi:hypothetical protein
VAAKSGADCVAVGAAGYYVLGEFDGVEPGLVKRRAEMLAQGFA